MSERLSGWRRQQLIIDFAKGDLTDEQLSEKYDRAVSTITTNRYKWREETAALQAEGFDTLANLWSTQKALRIATWQQEVEELDVRIEELFEQGEGAKLAGLVRMKQNALAHIAEELGQLPTRVTAQVEGNVEYRIVGVNPTDVT